MKAATKIFIILFLSAIVLPGYLCAPDNLPLPDSAMAQPVQAESINPTQNNNIEESLNASSQSIIRLQKNLIYFTLALVFLISIVAVLIYKGLKANKRLVAELLLSNQSISEEKQQLEKLVAVKNKIFSIISHDLKTPIVSLNNSLEVMKNEMVKKELKKKALESSKQQLDNTINLLNNLLDWAKNQMEEIKPKLEQVNICESISQNIQLVEQAAAEKGISIQVDCKNQIVATADNELINLVLRNLLSNAVKFTPKEGQITVSAFSANGVIKISVKDTGIGISPDDQKMILSPDKFIKKYGTDYETGSGIGLKLCLDYIKYMEGELTLKANLGLAVFSHLPCLLATRDKSPPIYFPTWLRKHLTNSLLFI